MEEKEIITSVLNGQTELFGILVERYSAPLYRLCRSLCGNPADAEDAVQEAFFDAFRYLSSLEDKEKFYPWLSSIARRKAFRQIRHRHTDADIDEMTEFLSSDCDFTEEELFREENRARVFRAVGRLSDKRRIVCELFYFRNMKVSEIAEKLSLSESTVKSRLYDTRESLRKELCDMNENQENITALEEKIKEQIKHLSYYYSLNGGQFDEGYQSIVRDFSDLVDRIRDEQKKLYYLSYVLFYQSNIEKDSDKKKSLREQGENAAERGKNVAFVVDKLINDYFAIHDDSEQLRFFDETAFPKISGYVGSPDFNYAEGALHLWRGRTLLSLNRLEEARIEFETAASLIEKSDVYQANAVAALRNLDRLETFAYDRKKGFYATAEGLIFENGRLVFHNQPGFSEYNSIAGDHFDFNSFIYYASVCKSTLFDLNMKSGDKLTAPDEKAALTCVSYDESVSVPAGSFDHCLHMRTEAELPWRSAYTMDVWYAPDAGPVKISALHNGKTETYVLIEYTVTGGEGYFPFAVGNRWVYRNPDAPEYIYHDIERTVEYTDGYLTNLAVSSPIAQKKDFDSCADLDSQVYLSFADQLCDDWKLDEAIEMLKKAVRLNVNEEAVRISLYGIEVLNRFAEYQKKGYRFLPSSIWASYLQADENEVKYQNPCVISFGPYRYGARGAYEDRIFGMKPFRYLDEFMKCLWNKKWVPGYCEQQTVKDGLTLLFTVEDGGSITVPAGTFDGCRKITIRVDKPADADERWYFQNGYSNMDGGRKEYWFAPGIGIVKIISTWGVFCNAECLLSKYSVPASEPYEFLPIQIGNSWEYDEPHLTEEGYRAKAIFRIASGMNGKYLMTSAQEFICFKTEDEYNEFVKVSHLY